MSLKGVNMTISEMISKLEELAELEQFVDGSQQKADAQHWTNKAFQSCAYSLYKAEGRELDRNAVVLVIDFWKTEKVDGEYQASEFSLVFNGYKVMSLEGEVLRFWSDHDSAVNEAIGRALKFHNPEHFGSYYGLSKKPFRVHNAIVDLVQAMRSLGYECYGKAQSVTLLDKEINWLGLK